MSTFPAAVLLTALQLLQADSVPAEGVRVERVAFVMGTRLAVVVEGGAEGRVYAAAERALGEVERMDALLSTWDPRSAMSSANAAPVGEPHAAPAELVGLLAEAERWAAATGRAFDPTVGALVDAWDLRGEGRRPTGVELRRALGATGPGAFDVHPGSCSLTRRAPLAWIDTGGFGKGAALRSARALLEREGAGRAFLDLGGQVLALGPEPWRVDVAHPSRRHEAVASLELRGVSAATSGTSERWIEVGGERLGHLLDPRTGLPVPAWGSVTVVSADPLVADALSTALYVMGPDAGFVWARSRTDVGVLFLAERDGRVVPSWNPAMEAWLDAGSLQTTKTER